MLVYHEIKAQFDQDVLNGNIADAIKPDFRLEP